MTASPRDAFPLHSARMRAPRPWTVLAFTLAALFRSLVARADVDAATPTAPPVAQDPAASMTAEPTPPTTPSPPAAPAAKPAGPKQFPKLRYPPLVHTYQLGLAVLPGIGFRVIAPYAEGVDCGQQGKRVCTGLLPFFIDVQPSFGFAEHWDLLVDLRFGLGTDFNQRHQFAVAPGLRYWVDPEQHTKFFATIQGVFDATPQNNASLRRNDFGIRNENGFMFEVMRNLGFYLQFGETIGFARWLRFEIDAGVGVQARIP
jgi:hypothetical protein